MVSVSIGFWATVTLSIRFRDMVLGFITFRDRGWRVKDIYGVRYNKISEYFTGKLRKHPKKMKKIWPTSLSLADDSGSVLRSSSREHYNTQ